MLLIRAILTVELSFPHSLWRLRNGSCRSFVYMLFLGIPSASRSVLYIVRKTFLRRSQRRWNHKKRCGIDGDIQEISLTIMNHGGNEVWSLGITFRQPKRRRTDTSDVAMDFDERGTKHSSGILY